jgi:hypothetical protein
MYLPNNTILLVNIDKFEPNPILVNISNLKPYRYLGKAPKGLEATIEGGRKHKEDSENKDSKNKKDSQKDFHYGFTKNQIT